MKAPVRVRALVEYRRLFEAHDLHRAHQAVGWGIGAINHLRDRWGKSLWCIKHFLIHQEANAVIIEADVVISHLTIEDDAKSWLRKVIQEDEDIPIRYDGWHWGDLNPESWDSVEIVGDITVLTGEATGVFIGRKPERAQECESV